MDDLPVLRVVTIGVYGFTAGTFLEELAEGGVGLLLDLRQRRGVRGADYSWANSARLQRALAAADIGYRHMKELAPTTELRQLQYREDDRQGVGKRNRIALAPEYAERYTQEILDPFDLGLAAGRLPRDHARRALRGAGGGLRRRCEHHVHRRRPVPAGARHGAARAAGGALDA